MEVKNEVNLEAFNTIIAALKELDSELQIRTLKSVLTLLNIDVSEVTHRSSSSSLINTINTAIAKSSESNFTDNRSALPKEFLRDKSPKTDFERIACLAYYLTHFRDTPHFKTIDISTLNTEAAQPKFSNAAASMENATKAGILVQATQGRKQLSAAGELFVRALPDREAAKAELSNIRFRKKPKKVANKNVSKAK
ncbi:hypothetical protein [Pollutibacter soli]|uniref:hypothetical protein n=1 Tax=Pollutibacter soli TaxID=3034157 RepID=UPI0030135C5E